MAQRKPLFAVPGGLQQVAPTDQIVFDASAATVTNADGTTSTIANSLAAKPNAANPAMTGAATLLEGQTASPGSSHGGLTFQNTSTAAADVLGPQQPPSYFTHDGIRSTVVNKSGSTAQTTSAFGFYTISYSTKDTTGVFGTSVAAVDNTSVWGLNPTVIDAPANGQVTNGVGRKLIGAEFDFSVTSPNTIVSGVNVTGSSIAQPAGADAFQVGDLCAGNPGKFKWTHGLTIGDATSQIGILVGAAALTGSSVAGIPNYFNYRDSAGYVRARAFGVTGGGDFSFGGPSAANGILVTPAAAGAFPSIATYGSDANPSLQIRAQGSGQIQILSTLNATAGFYSGGTAQFAVPPGIPVYTVATLPTPGQVGHIAYATNARVLAPSGGAFALQAAGAGTGGLVSDDGNAWRVVGTNQGVAA